MAAAGVVWLSPWRAGQLLCCCLREPAAAAAVGRGDTEGRWEMGDGSGSDNEKEKAGDVMELDSPKSIYLIICGCENLSSDTGSVAILLFFT